jgi:hypothetical protein
MKSGTIVVGAFLLGLSACAPGAGESLQGPQSLDEVQIPEDFTFATTKGMTLRAEGEPAQLAAIQSEVRLPNGELIHRGPLTPSLRLAIPAAVDSLNVTLRDANGERTVQVATTAGEGLVPLQ